MRLIVFFDLPSVTKKDLMEYRRFRKFLIKNGFIMMQESVYSRLVLNNNSTKLLKNQLKKNLPSAGLVQVMQITEKQFNDIEYLIGKGQCKIIDSMDRVVQI
ncbi:MAG: CRISPR-associated endonuclease Cas2 [Clostridia bacterium]|nr:CRISPR-associated endonuclease Cas2 [Clostridia bacterium]